MNKRQRQRLIRRILKQRPIASQHELVEALAEAGCAVTQATVSRDLRELGLQKTRGADGKTCYVYVLGADDRRDPPAACARMLREFGRSLDTAQNLLVLRCDPGAAPSMGRVIDELDHELILGCVAGDDTVIVVTKDAEAAQAVYAYFQQLGG